MRDAEVGRILAASLHQGIADPLPARLRDGAVSRDGRQTVRGFRSRAPRWGERVSGSRRARPRPPRAALLVCALVLGAGPAWAQTRGAAPTRFLVVPFENTGGEGRVHWLTEASAIILTDDLDALGVPAIGRDDRVRVLERLRVPAVAALSHATIIRLGQMAGAEDVVVGGYTLTDDTLTVRARTIRLDVGRMSEEIVESGPIADLFAIYAGLTRRIVAAPRVTLEEMERIHPPPAAFEQYVKGLLAEVPATRISYLTHARRLAPEYQPPALALWRVHHDQGEHAEALAALRGVPDGDRLYRRARFLSSVSLMHLERYDEAFEALAALNQREPDPALFNNMGVVQLRRDASAPGGRPISFFGDALRMDGADSDLMFNLGYAYFLDRELSQAVSWLREAVRHTTTDGEAHYVLGAALLLSGSAVEGAREKDLARRLSSDLAEFDAASAPGEVPPGLERVKTDIDIPASLRVEAAIVEAGQRDQRDLAALHLANGRRLYATGRDGDALAELRRVVYLSPYDREAHLLIGRLHLRGGRSSEAIDALKISIWSEDTVAARLALAEAHIAARDAEAGRAELDRVLQMDPGNGEAQRLLDGLP